MCISNNATLLNFFASALFENSIIVSALAHLISDL